MSSSPVTGGCQCGEIRYSISGAPLLAAICHCTMCRRANAAPAVAWAMYQEDQVTFHQGEPKEYRSSPEATRGFCQHCGTQISFRAAYIPGLVDITIGSLDNPNAVKPDLHYWYSEHLSWVAFADTLPKHPEFPPQETAD
jgi:hypothetical protein